MKSILKTKDGFSYIITCCLVLAVVMIIAVSLQYSLIFNLANSDKKANQLAIDSVITKYSVEKYNSLKQGDAWENTIDKATLISKVKSELGFSGSNMQRTIAKNATTYTMTLPTITATGNDSIGVHVSYSLIVPFKAFGKTVTTITIPIEFVSSLIEK